MRVSNLVNNDTDVVLEEAHELTSIIDIYWDDEDMTDVDLSNLLKKHAPNLRELIISLYENGILK